MTARIVADAKDREGNGDGYVKSIYICREYPREYHSHLNTPRLLDMTNSQDCCNQVHITFKLLSTQYEEMNSMLWDLKCALSVECSRCRGQPKACASYQKKSPGKGRRSSIFGYQMSVIWPRVKRSLDLVTHHLALIRRGVSREPRIVFSVGLTQTQLSMGS